MVFNSFQFLAFFSVVLSVYWLLPLRAQKILLLVASYLFYMAWRAKYAVLIAGITVLDFCVGLGLGALEDRPSARRGLLVVSLLANLGVLFAFKYWNFLCRTLQDVGWLFQTDVHMPLLDVIIPLGLSFHTFQSLSYTIDAYQKKIPIERNLLDFALFVAFFPQLVAGPIERASHLLPQFHARREYDAEDLVQGLRLMILGFFKKMVVADNLAVVVDSVYGPGAVADPASIWLGTYAYAFQIYADFSGYSDIAIGVARMMGYRLTLNFDTPYFAPSVAEFWRRWHISLSTWLRDYLYVPLGGNRKGSARTYYNLMVTMILGGLWHGASWNFVIWGLLNGFYLAGYRTWAERVRPKLQSPRWNALPIWVGQSAGALLTFHLICFSWVFFRAQTLSQAEGMLHAVASSAISGAWWSAAALGRVADLVVRWRMPMSAIALLVLVDVWVGNGTRPDRWRLLPATARYAAYSALVLLTLTFGVFKASHFIYFQF